MPARRTTAEPAATPDDPQTDTNATGQHFEVLTQAPNGHRTVHRVTAKDRGAAERAISDTLDDGVRVLGTAAAGCGLGSG